MTLRPHDAYLQNTTKGRDPDDDDEWTGHEVHMLAGNIVGPLRVAKPHWPGEDRQHLSAASTERTPRYGHVSYQAFLFIDFSTIHLLPPPSSPLPLSFCAA